MADEENWATGEAENWITAVDEDAYKTARHEASFSLYRFRVWAEDYLTRLEAWDDEDTEDVDFEAIYGRLTEED